MTRTHRLRIACVFAAGLAVGAVLTSIRGRIGVASVFCAPDRGAASAPWNIRHIRQ
jgi:hypothetical protein